MISIFVEKFLKNYLHVVKMSCTRVPEQSKPLPIRRSVGRQLTRTGGPRGVAAPCSCYSCYALSKKSVIALRDSTKPSWLHRQVSEGNDINIGPTYLEGRRE